MVKTTQFHNFAKVILTNEIIFKNNNRIYFDKNFGIKNSILHDVVNILKICVDRTGKSNYIDKRLEVLRL